jgi:hypothetical protein
VKGPQRIRVFASVLNVVCSQACVKKRLLTGPGPSLNNEQKNMDHPFNYSGEDWNAGREKSRSAIGSTVQPTWPVPGLNSDLGAEKTATAYRMAIGLYYANKCFKHKTQLLTSRATFLE